MQKSRFLTVQNLVLLALLSALVLVLSQISIPIGEISRIHFGNIMCLLAGLLFGPLIGGLSAGIGSMLFDLFNPLYLPEFWITFITKFAMGFMAGLLNRKLLKNWQPKLRTLVSAAGGSALYIVLYLIKSFFWEHYVSGVPVNAMGAVLATKAVASCINGALAVAGSVLLALVLEPALRAAGLFQDKQRHSPT